MDCFVVFSSSNVKVNTMVREMEYLITQALIVFKLENFEDTKGVVRIHKSKKDRQHKRQKKRDKTKNNYSAPSVYRPPFYRQNSRLFRFPPLQYPVILPNSATAIRHSFSDTKVVNPI
jgi:hypothetical protein